MADRMRESALAWLPRFSKYSAVLVTLLGGVVLTGWAFHIPRLKVIIGGQVAIKANTAACFILVGLALWLVLEEKERRRFQRGVSRFLALTAGLIGLLSFLEVWYGWDLGIDQLLFTAGAEDIPGSVRPGLMSGITAADFFLLGIMISLLDVRGRWCHWVQNLFAAIASVAAMFGILDFVLDPEQTHTHIAPLTALILFMLSLAVLCARTQWGLGALLVSTTAGGQLCRRLLPGTILIPIGIGWLRWKGQQIGFYSDWTGLAIMTVTAVALLASLTLWTAFAMRQAETEQRQAEERARRLAAIVTCSSDAIVGKTLDGLVTSWNPGAEAVYGYSADEMIGQCVTRVIPPDRLEEFQNFLQRLRRGETIHQYETERTRKDGKRISVSITVSPLRDERGNISGASTIARDITDSKQAEQKLRRINQTLQALSACTDSMMRASDESGMLQQVCDAVIEVGGYRMAWVGYAEHDQNKSVRPVANCGMEAGYLLTANITWADVERGRGPTGVAVRTGKTVVSRDFAEDSRLGPWRKEAVRCGFRSSIALPLRSEDQILGAVTVYSAEIDAFDSREQQLLEQLSINLSYAIMALRARAQSDLSAQKLRESALYVRSLLEASLDPLVTISKEGKITDVNEATEKATGMSRAGLIGSDFCDYFSESQKAREGYQRVFEQGFVRDYPLAIRSASGEVLDVLYNATVFKGASGEVEGVFAAARDVTELKRTEQELRLSRERLALALKAGHSGTFDWDIQNNINIWTPEAEEVHGLAPGEFGGRYEDWEALVLPEDLPAARKNIENSLKSQEFAGEWRIRRRNDGEIRWITARAKILRDDQGKACRMIGVNTDITDRKRAEQALVESETKFRALSNFVPQLVWMCTPDGLNVYFNHRWVEYTGMTLEQSYGKGWNTPFHPDDKQAAWEAWNRAVATGESYRVESRLRAADGTYRWFLMRGVRLSDPAGIVKWFGTCTDIDDMKRAEAEIMALNRSLETRVEQRTAELRESEQRVRRKLDHILLPEGDLGNLELADILDVSAIQSLLDDFHSVVHVTTALIDLQGKIVAVVGWQNICREFHRAHPDSCKFCVESDRGLSTGIAEGAFKIYQCKNHMLDVASPIVVGGKHLGNLFCGQFFFADEPIDHEVFRAQARTYGFDERRYMAALEEVPRLTREQVNTTMTFLGKLAKMISQLSYSSIKLARSTEQVNRANSDLQNTVNELEAFTYSVSHDLRAPLRHISGFSKILSEEFSESLPAEAKHHLQRIQEGTRRMGQLVDDLLNLGRVGRKELSLQVAGVRSIVDDIIADLQSDVGERQVEWKIGDLPYVECDTSLTQQVFQNLLSNALKFTRPRAHAVIEIGQERRDGEAVLYVRDNGVGFSMKYVGKLFGVFQRLHRPEDFEGTGVGLATVQRIIQKHGGRIWAEAELDKGATFYLTFGNFQQNEVKTDAVGAGGQA